MPFSQSCRSSHWMWCSMYRWNIHWLAHCTRLVGKLDTSMHVCSGSKMRFSACICCGNCFCLSLFGDAISASWYFATSMLLYYKFCFPFWNFTFRSDRVFLLLTPADFGKQISPLISFFPFKLFFPVSFRIICFLERFIVDFDVRLYWKRQYW